MSYELFVIKNSLYLYFILVLTESKLLKARFISKLKSREIADMCTCVCQFFQRASGAEIPQIISFCFSSECDCQYVSRQFCSKYANAFSILVTFTNYFQFIADGSFEFKARLQNKWQYLFIKISVLAIASFGGGKILNTQYMTNLTIVSPVKMEYG